MDDAEKIENLIEVMQQLKELEKVLQNTAKPDMVILGLILALIHGTKIPDVTILTTSRDMAYA
tara:strand:- start:27 stop:215 length:189 start_codon:yes stop_codon:yes gene_type:complete